MKKCPNCGASMDADVNFCTNCGTKCSTNCGTIYCTTKIFAFFKIIFLRWWRIGGRVIFEKLSFK